MIRKASEMREETISSMRGGEGEVKVVHILERNEFNEKGRLYARNILKPGTSIGFHRHEGDFETYYILRGEGTIDDNGKTCKVYPGDMIYTKNGDSHGIKNTGDTDLEFIALVLFD